MKMRGWTDRAYGILPNYDETDLHNNYEVMDVTFRDGTRTLLIPIDEINELDSEDFDTWYTHRTKGFEY